ncbi:DUF427 domain-containing protein [Stakelama sp. CBK3Z-3]|uniref:DUF427 domain-containing protein n=1 Tax=Stakelama flava TaxID=2860338 RepID=A0ABS6XRB9_9SPHN|nr:DUF427 domain-containing protein [Stakelama flava]MBW4332338.1 DUF427 domain-containing protein [Stakelama flava]
MTKREKLTPGSDHPIAVAPYSSEVVVTAGSRRIARTRSALILQEATYPPVYYIPREDVDMSLLERSEHTSYCPYKGDASYYSIPALGETGQNSAWTYEAPFDAVAGIKDHLAFYTDRVSVELKD